MGTQISFFANGAFARSKRLRGIRATLRQLTIFRWKSAKVNLWHLRVLPAAGKQLCLTSRDVSISQAAGASGLMARKSRLLRFQRSQTSAVPDWDLCFRRLISFLYLPR